jgi:hypothetical protein
MAKPYVPHDVLDETAKTSLVGLGSGFFIAAIQNAMSRRNVGALSVFTRGAPIIGICGMDFQTLEAYGSNWTDGFCRGGETIAKIVLLADNVVLL